MSSDRDHRHQGHVEEALDRVKALAWAGKMAAASLDEGSDQSAIRELFYEIKLSVEEIVDGIKTGSINTPGEPAGGADA